MFHKNYFLGYLTWASFFQICPIHKLLLFILTRYLDVLCWMYDTEFFSKNGPI